MRLQAVDPKEFAPSLLPAFGRENALLAAGDKSGCNAMTIGWCQAGRLWNLPVCTVYVRPEAVHLSVMEKNAMFTVSVLPESAREPWRCSALKAAGIWIRSRPAA